jgi:hypothetical protein
MKKAWICKNCDLKWLPWNKHDASFHAQKTGHVVKEEEVSDVDFRRSNW